MQSVHSGVAKNCEIIGTLTEFLQSDNKHVRKVSKSREEKVKDIGKTFLHQSLYKVFLIYGIEKFSLYL